MAGLAFWLTRTVHALYVGVIAVAPLVILAGAVRRVDWLAGRWVRGAHLAGIAFVTLQFVFGWGCPLTELERAFASGSTFDRLLPPELTSPASIDGDVIAIVTVYLLATAAAHVLAIRMGEPVRRIEVAP